MSEVNKAAAREIIAMFSSGDVSGAEALIARDAVDHQGMPGIDTSGVEGIKRLIALFHVAFPDLHVHIEDIIAEGDRVVMRMEMHGTHQGELMGIPPTGKQISVESIDIMRFENGKAVEHWGVSDNLTMMQQLGVVPA